MQQLQQSLLQKADSDKDGSLSLEEFSSAGPAKNSSEANAADQARKEKLFKSIDEDGDGKASESELGSFFSKMSTETRSSLLSMQEGNGGGNPMADLLSNADEDGSGTMSLDEFAAAGPKDASADKAAEIFGEMDTDSDGEVTEDELSSFGESHRPPPPGGGRPEMSGTSDTGSSIAELLASASETKDTDEATSLAEILGQISSGDDQEKDASADFSKQLSSLLQQMTSSYVNSVRSNASTMSLNA
tara:strand:+ start:190062 stop:190799 length:738 start_codon:yes stop_codon:yes gene_type:complete